jgi:hypothetical protein
MKITEKLAALGKADEPYFSLEFFPPKTDMVCSLPLAEADCRGSQTSNLV